jgi:hypothetical protein
MNTYDPAHYIRYVHLDGPAEPPPVVTRLPAGYADESPRTSLRRSGRAQFPERRAANR